jgi:hypothetical protein
MDFVRRALFTPPVLDALRLAFTRAGKIADHGELSAAEKVPLLGWDFIRAGRWCASRPTVSFTWKMLQLFQ